MAAWVGVACYFSKNAAFQWRFPLILQCLWPLAMLILAPFLPESPRWCKYHAHSGLFFNTNTCTVLMNDRTDEAWEVVLKLHANEKDKGGSAYFAEEEFYQMKHQVIADKNSAAGETIWTLFTRPSYRKRMICAFLTMFGAASTGILVIYSASTLQRKPITPL